jgi:hypothetical protein
MNVMRMNQDYVSQYSIIDEEPNVDATKFFWFFKRFWLTIMRWLHKSISPSIKNLPMKCECKYRRRISVSKTIKSGSGHLYI